MNTLYRVGCWILALGLLLLGISGMAVPELQSGIYGVPTTEPAWVSATSLRDVALGVMAIGFLVKQPAAMRVFLPAMILVPLADVVFVLLWGEHVWAITPHALGTVVIVALAVLSRTHAPT
jgi:hypothetical protein